MACQVFIIYVSSAMFKIQGSLWDNGTAIYYAMHIRSLEAFPMLNGVITNHLSIVFVATYGTVFLQLFFPFLQLTRPTRILALAGIIGMHVGIGILSGIAVLFPVDDRGRHDFRARPDIRPCRVEDKAAAAGRQGWEE